MKDLKYIIKRVIIGVLIAIILMCINSVKAHAVANNILTIYHPIAQERYYEIGTNNIISDTRLDMSNWGYDFGNGYIYLNMYISTSNSNVNRVLMYAMLTTNQGTSYACDIGNASVFQDSNIQKQMYSLKCPIYLGPNDRLDTIRYRLSNVQSSSQIETNIIYGPVITFVPYHIESNNSNQGVVSAVTNVNTSINNQTQQVTNSINNLDDTLTNNDSADNQDVTGALNAGNLPGGGAISAILTLPLTIINQVLSVLGQSCTNAIIPLPFINQNVTLPCVDNLFVQMGFSTYWETFGLLAGAIVLYYYLLYLYDRVNHILFLEDKGDLRRYY